MRLKREKQDRKKAGFHRQNTFKTDVSNQFYEKKNSVDLDVDNVDVFSKNVLKYLIEKYKQENHVDEEDLTMKKIEQYLKQKGQLGEEAREYIRNVTELEGQLKNLFNNIQIMKRNELNRINKEFYTNDYERRFKVTQEIMISAIVGEDNSVNEMHRQRRDQRTYFQKLESIRTYDNLFKKKIHNLEHSNSFNEDDK